MSISDRIRTKLSERRWTTRGFQQRVEAAAPEGIRGVSYPSVREYVRGETEPPLTFLRVAAGVLGVNLSWLVTGLGPERGPLYGELDLKYVIRHAISEPDNDEEVEFVGWRPIFPDWSDERKSTERVRGAVELTAIEMGKDLPDMATVVLEQSLQDLVVDFGLAVGLGWEGGLVGPDDVNAIASLARTKAEAVFGTALRLARAAPSTGQRGRSIASTFLATAFPLYLRGGVSLDEPEEE